jgi:entericidin B
MKRVIGFIVAIAMLTLVGCNTIRGMGKDVEKGGEAIQKSTN